LLKAHVAQQHDELTQQALEARDDVGNSTVSLLLRYCGTLGGTLMHCGGMFQPVMPKVSDEDDDTPDWIFKRSEAVELTLRLINDCGASVTKMLQPAIEYAAPRAVIHAIRASPSSNTSELVEFGENTVERGRSVRSLEHVPLTILAALRRVANDLHQAYLQKLSKKCTLARAAPAYNLPFVTDWFGKAKSFDTPADAWAYTKKGCTDFCLELLDSDSIDWSESNPFVSWLVREAASIGSVDLVEEVCRRVSSTSSEDSVRTVLNAPSKYFGITSIHCAGTPDVVSALLARGADVNALTLHRGFPPAVFLSRQDDSKAGGGLAFGFARAGTAVADSGCDLKRLRAEAICSIFSAGGSVMWKDAYRSPCGSQDGFVSVFAAPVSSSDLAAVRSLVQVGAHPSHGPRRVDEFGNTLLHLACKNLTDGSRRILHFLLFDCNPAARLSPMLQNYAGMTPMDLVTSQQQNNPKVATAMLELLKKAKKQMRSQLGYDDGDEQSELQDFFAAPLAPEADAVFLQQSPIGWELSPAFGFQGQTIQPDPWAFGDIDSTDEAQDAAAEATKTLETDGVHSLEEQLSDMEELEADLKRRYERAHRDVLAVRAVLFQQKLDLFDRGRLPVDEKVLALFPAPAATGEDDDAGGETEEARVHPRVLQIHALFHVWMDNGLPKNDFNQYIKLSPPGQPDLWQLVQHRWGQNPRGKLSAQELYDVVTDKDPAPANPSQFMYGGSVSDAMLLAMNDAERAAYVLAMVKANMGSCCQS
jgi:hypothetical protein